jgi:hypothetical protein
MTLVWGFEFVGGLVRAQLGLVGMAEDIHVRMLATAYIGPNTARDHLY